MKFIHFALVITVAFITIYGVKENDSKIVAISIPKCGTTLLLKCIKLMINKHHQHIPKINDLQNPQKMLGLLKQELEKSTFVHAHMKYSKLCGDHLRKNKLKTIFIYRDPRDMVVSLAFYMIKNKWSPSDTLSFNELLTYLIPQIQELYDQFAPWSHDSQILSICFEDLIGQQGGGLQEKQYDVLKQLAYHLEIDLTLKKIDEISKNLFGGTHTFREGKIGAWRTCFKEEHIVKFKKHAGQLLIDWNYEKDLNW